MLDIELFQGKILEAFVPDYKSQSLNEKESILREYLKTIQDNYEEAEILMQDSEGYFNAGVTYAKLEQDARPEEEDIWKRKKKKKEQLKTDFYKFQLKAANDKRALNSKSKQVTNESEESSNVEGHIRADGFDDEASEPEEEEKLEDPDYLKKRKQALASSFQQQLAEINKKKLKML